MNTFEVAVFGVVIMVVSWLAFDWAWSWLTGTKERHASATTDQSCQSMARAIRGEDRRPLSDRVARDLDRRYATAAFHFPADAHAPEKLDRESGYGTSTRLSVVPKGDAA